jgi:hypothetical protein
VTTANLALADALKAMLRHLRQHAGVLAEVSGDAARVGGTVEAPYPRFFVGPSSGGDDRDLRWLIEPELAVATYGDLDGTPGSAELWRMHYVLLGACTEVVGAAPAADIGVVSLVSSSSSARWEPEPLTGEPAWRSTLRVRIHPPVALP